MLRCALALTLAAAAFACVVPASARAPRNFPATALRGDLTVLQPPEVLLNGKPARLAPGARVRGADNLLVTTGTLAGQRFLAHYTLDLNGTLLDVWVLTAAEAARRPWPTTPEQAATWRFDPIAQTWTRR